MKNPYKRESTKIIYKKCKSCKVENVLLESFAYYAKQYLISFPTSVKFGCQGCRKEIKI